MWPQRFLIGRAVVGLVGLDVLLVALDGKQELMKLPADAPFRPSVLQVLERPLEAPKGPLQRDSGVLVHIFSNSHVTKFHA